MADLVPRIDLIGSAKSLAPIMCRPRILISGACRGIGLRSAEALAERGAELLLCDIDAGRVLELAERLGAAASYPRDVSSETSVSSMADDLLGRFGSLDMLINAAGGGYARTLGMYRVSRALMPALRAGGHKLLVNVPPSAGDADAPAFPYASSRLAFHRLSSALAFEARGTSIAVMIACPAKRRLTTVYPDPNAGSWAESCDLRRPSEDDLATLAWQVASLLDGRPAIQRHAG